MSQGGSRESPVTVASTPRGGQDTILLDVNSLMYDRIVDVRKAIYEVRERARVGAARRDAVAGTRGQVEDLQSAIVNVAQTQLKVRRGPTAQSPGQAGPRGVGPARTSARR